MQIFRALLLFIFCVLAGNTIAQKSIYFVEISRIPTQQEQEQLKSQGIELLRFYRMKGSDAYIVAAENESNFTSFSHFISSVKDSIPAAFRIHPEVEEGITTSDCLDENGSVLVSVSLFHAEAWEYFVKSFITFETDVADTREVKITQGDIKRLLNEPEVAWIGPCLATPVPDNKPGGSSHRSDAIRNVNNGTGVFDGSGIRVMVQDDGEIGPHIDFTGRLYQSNATASTGDHGDHVSGTVGGAGNLNPIATGMAPGAELFIYRAAPTYNGFSNIANAYNNEQIRITSTSYSDGCNAGYTTRTRDMDLQSRTYPSLLHVFSAGNEGTADCGYGAGSGWGNITGGHKAGKNVIAVANLTASDVVAASSSRGPAHDGRLKPDVSGVGTSVYSTIENNTYATFSGTSMSCPGVSGTLAQLYQAWNAIYGFEPRGDVMKAILMNTADDLGNPGPDFKYGYGRINALKALEVMNTSQVNTHTSVQSVTDVHPVTVASGTKLVKWMIYWHDVEAATGVFVALVNDLDFYAIDPAGDTIRPWVLDHTPNPSLLNSNAVRGIDHLNNAEQITIENPMPGAWQLFVNGHSIPMGPQEYVLTSTVETEALRIVYPMGDEGFVPGEFEVIKWDAAPDANTFDLSYSADDGISWTSIATGINNFSRMYSWLVPDTVSGHCKLKLERSTQTYITQKFNIIKVPTSLQVDWACNDSVRLSWNPVEGAITYDVYQLGVKYMQQAGAVADTFAVLAGTGLLSDEWFSVRARGTSDAKGRRAIAIKKPVGYVDCPLPVDIGIAEVYVPANGLIPSCHDLSALYFSVLLHNNGIDPVSGFPVAYSVDGATVQETYTGTLLPGQTDVFTFTTSLDFSATGTHITKFWVAATGDDNLLNDTLVSQSRVTTMVSTAYPMVQNFESNNTCSVVTLCTTGCNMGTEWLNEPNGAGDDTDWRVHSGTTATDFTGPQQDADPGTISGKYAYIEANNCSQKTANLISPCVDLPASGNIEFRANLHFYGGIDMGNLHIDLFDGTRWYYDIVSPQTQNAGNFWLTRQADLSAFAGKKVNIRFRGTSGTNERGDFAIDGIRLSEPVGVEDYQSNTSVIYPNPAQDVLFIQNISSGVVAIYDAGGRLVTKKQITGNQIEISDLPAGLYILELNEGKYRFVKSKK
jgi:hypothetical protein